MATTTGTYRHAAHRAQVWFSRPAQLAAAAVLAGGLGLALSGPLAGICLALICALGVGLWQSQERAVTLAQTLREAGRSQRRLEKVRLSTFAASLAHEMRNILTHANMAVSMLQETAVGPDVEDIADAKDSINRLSLLSNNLADYSRTLSDSDVEQTFELHDAVALAIRTNSDAGIDVSLAQQPSQVGPVPGCLHAVSEVLRSALTPADNSHSVAAVIDVHQADGELTIVIRHGATDGTQQTTERILASFPSLVDRWASRLWLSRRIVIQHGGDLRVEHDHKGLRFELRLPTRPIAQFAGQSIFGTPKRLGQPVTPIETT